MRSWLTQEKNIHIARAYAGDKVTQAIQASNYCKEDKDTMLRIINATYDKTALQIYEDADTMVREAIQDIIEETYYGRKHGEGRICPNCGKEYFEPPALSRDGKTVICSDCGMQEALAAYVQSTLAEKKQEG